MMPKNFEVKCDLYLSFWKMLSTTMEKFKKDTGLDFPVLTTTSMEEVQNTKFETLKNLDFVFCNLYTTRIGLKFQISLEFHSTEDCCRSASSTMSKSENDIYCCKLTICFDSVESHGVSPVQSGIFCRKFCSWLVINFAT